jgi:hypothetical protein
VRPQTHLGGPAGPEEGPGGTAEDAEETMGYVLFLVIAFVLLGAERIVARWHTHSIGHEVPPR